MYIIEAENGSLYTGITKDLQRRLQEHQGSEKSAKFFRSSPAKKMVFSKSGFTYSKALIEEARIKKLTKLKKLEFISLHQMENRKTKAPVKEINKTTGKNLPIKKEKTP